MSQRLFVRNYIANAVDIADTDLHYVIAVAIHMPGLIDAGPQWDALIRSKAVSLTLHDLGISSPPPYHARGRHHFEKWRREALETLDAEIRFRCQRTTHGEICAEQL